MLYLVSLDCPQSYSNTDHAQRELRTANFLGRVLNPQNMTHVWFFPSEHTHALLANMKVTSSSMHPLGERSQSETLGNNNRDESIVHANIDRLAGQSRGSNKRGMFVVSPSVISSYLGNKRSKNTPIITPCGGVYCVESAGSNLTTQLTHLHPQTHEWVSGYYNSDEAKTFDLI